jgi:hypothetical protein
MNCADSSGGNCILFQGNFLGIPLSNDIDGTPCSINGVCLKGVCSNTNPATIVLSWLISNPQYSIPAAVLVGFVFLCCIYGCCKSRKLPKEDNEALKSKSSGK